MAGERKYQVFISSTFSDLQKERRVLQDLLLSQKFVPVGMETFLGSEKTLPQYLKDLIDACDYYVVIVAGRYGSKPKGSDKSWTELEYDYAASTGIPILAFFKSSDSDRTDEIKAFMEKIRENHVPIYWTDKGDLAGKVFRQLTETKTARPGWVRADRLLPEEGASLLQEFKMGRDEQYRLAQTLFDKPCKYIFLLQRSSSLVLDAEKRWPEEGAFIKSLKDGIDEMPAGGELYHITTIEGIKEHLKSSRFPEFKKNIKKGPDGSVIVDHHNPFMPEKEFEIRKLPKDSGKSLFVTDRQARACISETKDGYVRAVIVQNLGGQQISLMLTGPNAEAYLKACITYYKNCEPLKWQEIDNL